MTELYARPHAPYRVFPSVTYFVWRRGARALRYKSKETRRYSSTVTAHSNWVMETLRNTSYPNITAHNENMCELNKISEQGWKKPEDNSRTSTEYSRIITDPNTGKCYCRGKVLGKVMGSIIIVILFKIWYLFKSIVLFYVKNIIHCICAWLHCFCIMFFYIVSIWLWLHCFLNLVNFILIVYFLYAIGRLCKVLWNDRPVFK